jgi:PTS system cellobiose-specific IIC component
MQEFLEEKFTPFAARMGANKYLIAIRDGITIALPLILIGSFFMVVASLPIPGWADLLAETGIGDILWKGTGSSFDLMGIVAAFGIAYSLTNTNGHDGLSAGIISLSAFVTATPFVAGEAGNGIPTGYTGSGGLLVALIIGITTGMVYSWFMKKDYRITMPEGVPPAISKSFSALIPGAVILSFWLFIYAILEFSGIGNIHDVIGIVLGGPLSLLGNNIFGTILLTGLNSLFWFVGIHGGNTINAVMQPIWRGYSGENLAAFQAGEELPHIITQQFIDYFVYMGGGGATLGLVIVIAIIARRSNASSISKTMAPLTLLPGIFNINEPAMFGLPIVLNFQLLIPFVLAPMVNAIIAYLAMLTGLVPLTTGIDVGWTMPPVINGFLATDNSIAAALLQVVLIIINMGIYYAFYRGVEQRNRQMELEEN